MESLYAQLAATSWLEGLAVLLALAYVWMAARQSIWCWPCALLSTGIYMWLFWQVTLPFHTVLNLYYLFMAIYGWMQWKKHDQKEKTVRSLSLYQHGFWLLILTLGAWALSHLAKGFLDASYLYLDAFITVFSVFTTILVAHKIRENWLYWMVINSFSAYLYFAKSLTLTGILFLCYLGFAVYGYMQWKVQPKKEHSLKTSNG
ncbi:nicotinamide riboside transporter PnuC [Paraglaciecola aestuariivivens]